MKKRFIKQNSSLLLIILLLLISVGFSVINSTININGSSIINTPTWNIYFDNIRTTYGSVSGINVVKEATIETPTSVEYSIYLKEPGNYYEFKVDVVNAGSIDAMVDIVSSKMNNVEITTLPNYLKYSVTYSDGNTIKQKDALDSGERESYKVRIEINRDINEEDLPEEEQTLSLTFSVTYKQKDNTGARRALSTLDIGDNVNLKIKQLAGNNTTENGYFTENTNITSFLYSEIEPTATNKEAKNIVSSGNSEKPIYMWYDNGTIYWWSEDKHPKLNEDAAHIFYNIKNLTNISGLQYFDASNTTTMNGLLFTTAVSNIEPIRNWDISNAENIRVMFSYTNITNVDALENWNTSNVTNMEGLFQRCYNIENLSGIKNWDVSNVENMQTMFKDNTKLTNLDALANWNVSNVKKMGSMFSGTTGLTNTDDLAIWNVSNVENMKNLFYGNTGLKNINGLANWNVSNVKDMGSMFSGNTGLKNLNGLANWNTSKVVDMSFLFHNCNNLEDASGIKDWDVSNVETMSHMFNISDDVGNKKYSTLRNLDLKNWNMPKVKDYEYFIESLWYVTAEFTIRNPSVENYGHMLSSSANKGGKIKVNYTSATSSLVTQMVATKSSGANVVKGSLVE